MTDDTQLAPNMRQTVWITPGISRNMQADLTDAPAAQGGGDLNGTMAPILFYQAGTNGSQTQQPRKAPCPGNYCGIV